MLCPCGSQRSLSNCCGPYLEGKQAAPTAEKLMRSRYSAYCLKKIDYLLKTHHLTYRKPNSRRMITTTANRTQWLGLTILSKQAGRPTDKTGIVEFVARFQEGDQVGQLHERSRFCQEGGRWFYLDGDILPPVQPKRNEPCWCNSGKKYKQCHGKR